MKLEFSDLLTVFDEQAPQTNEELGCYWLKYTRKDLVSLALIFSLYEGSCSIILRYDDMALSSVHLNHCNSIKVLDISKRQLEVIATYEGTPNIRCFLDLDGANILSIENY